MTSLFEIQGSQLVAVPRKKLANEQMLEEWIAKDPRLIGLDILVLGRQVITKSGGRIDILGIGREGDLAIIELKRDRTPRDIVAQVLD
jgi:RecB family endonuclease NucS